MKKKTFGEKMLNTRFSPNGFKPFGEKASICNLK